MSAEAWPIRPWLWPSHIAGKRETGKLREEHNYAINQMQKLQTALKNCLSGLDDTETDWKDACEILEATKELA